MPLVIAEQCYEQLLNEARAELVYAKNDRKIKKAYKLLLTIMEEYNVNLLSTKIYWEKQKEREEYKIFLEKYKQINSLEIDGNKELNKEILFIKNDLKKIQKDEKRYKFVIATYKKKLVELGEMKELKNKTTTTKGKFEKKKAKTEKRIVEEKTKKRGRPRKNG